MYEKLTKYLSDFDMDKIGKWTSEKHGKGTKDDPLLFPGMINSIPVHRFADEVTEFVLDHPEEELNHYYDILEENGLEWETDSMCNADVAKLDGRVVMALLVGAVRSEKYSDGALLKFFQRGMITNCLKRLKEIDDQN